MIWKGVVLFYWPCMNDYQPDRLDLRSTIIHEVPIKSMTLTKTMLILVLSDAMAICFNLLTKKHVK